MKRIFSTALSVITGGIFVYAGVLKIADPVAFYHAIALYHLVGDDICWHLAHYLPWVEIIAGVAVVSRLCRPSAALILAVLLLIFMTAVSSAWLRGLNIECGCFGRFSGASSNLWVLFRDFLLLLTVLYLGFSSFSLGRVKGT